MPDAVDLSFAVTLSPKEAVNYFESKGHKISWNWFDTWQESHAKAFTVAKATSMDVLTTIRGEVQKAIADGITLRDFQKDLTPKLQKLGWWGKQEIANPAGELENVQLGSPRRLRTIYNVNVQTAYMAGRYKGMLANVDHRPYWQYIAVIDSVTRPDHRAMHKRVFRYDDPIWQHLYPPNGWGCRCRVRALTAKQVERYGLEVESSTNALIESLELVSKKTGELRPVTGYRLSNGPLTGEVFKPDTGWSYNPGAAALNVDVNLWQKLRSIQSEQIKAELLRQVIDSDARRLAYEGFVNRVLTARKASGEVWPIGFLSDDIYTFLATKEVQPLTGVVAINDKQLLHADRQTKKDNEAHISADDYKALPRIIGNPDAVLWDTKNPGLMFVRKAFDSNGKELSKKIVVLVNYKLKKHGLINLVVTTTELPTEHLKFGQFEIIKGEL